MFVFYVNGAEEKLIEQNCNIIIFYDDWWFSFLKLLLYIYGVNSYIV